MPATVPAQDASLTEPSALLPTDPPPAIARGIATLIIAAFVLLVAVAAFVQVPETVRCPFVLVPKDGDDPVQTPYQAVVQAIHATEGQEVKKGEELFVLRADAVRTRQTRVHTMNEDLRSRMEIAEKLEEAHRQQLAIKDAELAQAERELEFRQKHVATSRDLVDRLTRLQAIGGLSEVDLARAQLDLAESEKNLNVTQKEVESVRLDRLRMETDRARQRDEEKSEDVKLALEVTSLEASLENAGDGVYSVRAPYDAVIVSLIQRNVGNVVQPGTELCHLARLDAVPHARLVLAEKGLPRLAVAERVRLFFDAFPYQRYGTVTGRLDWISPAAVPVEGSRSFTGDASLDQREVRVAGQMRPLRVGMKGEARVIVGSRTLLEYAFEPVHQLRENLRR